MGASSRRACTQPRRSDHRSSAWRLAELGSTGLCARRWTRDLGLPSRAAARRCAASTRRPGACVEPTRRGDLGGTGACGPCRALKLAGASGTHPACSPNLGGAAASTRIGATTCAAAGGAKLGRDPGTARANLGRATTGGARGPAAASRTGRSAGAASRRATTSSSRRAGSHLGIAARRAAGAAIVRRWWLGAARTFLGRRPACTGDAWTSRHRLGITAGSPAGASADATCTVVERACSRFVVGCLEDRGARGAACAVVGRACSGAFRSDPARAAAGSGVGATARCPARTWFGHVRRARRRRRCAGCGRR